MMTGIARNEGRQWPSRTNRKARHSGEISCDINSQMSAIINYNNNNYTCNNYRAPQVLKESLVRPGSQEEWACLEKM